MRSALPERRHRHSPCRRSVPMRMANRAEGPRHLCGHFAALPSEAGAPGGPDRRRLHAVSSSDRPLYGQERGEHPPFEQTGRCAVRFEMGCINHEPVRRPAFDDQCCEYAPGQRQPVQRAVAGPFFCGSCWIVGACPDAKKGPRFAPRAFPFIQRLIFKDQWIRRLCCLLRASHRLSSRPYVCRAGHGSA